MSHESSLFVVDGPAAAPPTPNWKVAFGFATTPGRAANAEPATSSVSLTPPRYDHWHETWPTQINRRRPGLARTRRRVLQNRFQRILYDYFFRSPLAPVSDPMSRKTWIDPFWNPSAPCLSVS